MLTSSAGPTKVCAKCSKIVGPRFSFRPVYSHIARQQKHGQRSWRSQAASDAVVDAPEQEQQASGFKTSEPEGEDEDVQEQSQEEIASIVQKSKYAVIDIGGVQMFVQEGRWYNCNRLEAEPGQTIQLGRVLAVKQNGKFNIGQPYLEGAVVKAEIVEDLKGPKLTIFKMNSKKHYRRKTGHRQPLTQFYIKEIAL